MKRCTCYLAAGCTDPCDRVDRKRFESWAAQEMYLHGATGQTNLVIDQLGAYRDEHVHAAWLGFMAGSGST